MLEISKKTDYGLELMRLLAKNYKKGPISLRLAAKKSSLPYRFLGQVVIPLKESGIISSREGVSGGYFLTRDPKKISLATIVELLEGEVRISDCVDCRRTGDCSSRKTWREVGESLLKQLERKTLASLI